MSSSIYLTFSKIQRYMISGSYLVFLLFYIVVLRLLLTKLKLYYPKFYEKERPKLLISNICIIVSIVSRIVITYLINIDEIWNYIVNSY